MSVQQEVTVRSVHPTRGIRVALDIWDGAVEWGQARWGEGVDHTSKGKTSGNEESFRKRFLFQKQKILVKE